MKLPNSTTRRTRHKKRRFSNSLSIRYALYSGGVRRSYTKGLRVPLGWNSVTVVTRMLRCRGLGFKSDWSLVRILSPGVPIYQRKFRREQPSPISVVQNSTVAGGTGGRSSTGAGLAILLGRIRVCVNRVFLKLSSCAWIHYELWVAGCVNQ